MDFVVHTPAGPAGRWIKEVFHYRGFTPAHRIERLVPTGCVSILFALDGVPRHTYDPTHLRANETYRGVWIYGMHRHHLSISAEQNSEMLVIRFDSPGALPFLHEPLDGFSDRLVKAKGELGETLQTHFERLKAAPESPQKFEWVDQWLAQRHRADLEPHGALVDAVHALRHDPAAQLAEVARRYPRTQKDLIAQFRLHLGMTPKYFQRLL